VGELLRRTKLSPDHLTLIGLLIACVAAVTIAIGELQVGLLLVICAALPDLFDGALAKASNQSSQRGAFFDSTIDRVVDVALIGALLLSLLKTDDRLALVAFVALIGGFLVSYVKARAQALSFTCDGGFAERAERVIILLTAVGFAGLGVPYILAVGVWVLAVSSLATFVFRVYQVWKQR
jgi:CDP-diacylglycerol--glycerol-3-phosphate 3-phosphatidyltransferase